MASDYLAFSEDSTISAFQVLELQADQYSTQHLHRLWGVKSGPHAFMASTLNN